MCDCEREKRKTKQGEIERERAVRLCNWERKRCAIEREEEKEKRKSRQEHREILQRNKVCVLGFSMGLKVSKGVSHYLVDIWDNIWFIVFVLVWNLGFCYVRFWGFTLFLKRSLDLIIKAARHWSFSQLLFLKTAKQVSPFSQLFLKLLSTLLEDSKASQQSKSTNNETHRFIKVPQ